jgi:hypothetical protein
MGRLQNASLEAVMSQRLYFFLTSILLIASISAGAQTFTVAPSSLSFPKAYVGMSTTSQTVTVTNTGSTSLTINSFSLTPFNVFLLEYGFAPRVLTPGQTAQYAVRFVPSSVGPVSGQLSISMAGVPQPSVVSLSGTGFTTSAVAKVTPGFLTFNTQPIGTTTSQTMTVTNIGHNGLHLGSVAVGPPFGIVGFTKKIGLNPGQSVTYQVTFSPTAAVDYSNTVAFSFDEVPSQSISLLGSATSVSSLTITNFPTLPTATTRFPYQATFTAVNGVGQLSWAVAPGSSLPPGLRLSASGAITGSPSQTGAYTFSVQVSDSNRNKAVLPVTLTVNATTGAGCKNIVSYIAGSKNPIIALNDLGTGMYLGSQGGLYPNGSNIMPASQDSAGVTLAAGIQPLDSNGNPNPNGIYALLSVGVSITRTVFAEFENAEAADPSRNTHLVLVNGAIDGTDSPDWADPSSGVWQTVLNYYLPYQNVSPKQVVAAWVLVPHDNPTGTFPSDMNEQQAELTATLQNLHTYFPNLLLAYVQSMHYGGYSNGSANGETYPEPYSFESGFATKWTIQDQISGQPDLNWNPALGPVVAPWLSWGFYDWANGLNARSDGFTWTCQDYESDGLHPSIPAGRDKAAGPLIQFFKTTDTTKPWFLQP